MRDNVLDRIAMAESGGNIRARANTPLSSAQGLFGFTDAAFKQVIQDNPDLAHVTKDQWSTDPKLQRVFAERFKNYQEGVLRNQGLDVNPVSLYANWHFGSGGGPKFLKAASNTPMEAILDPIAIQANPHLQGKTQGEVMQLLSQKMGQGQGNNGMNTNFPNFMANLPRTVPDIYGQLASIVRDPQIDPALVRGIAEKRQQNIQMLPLAVGAMLSGDKAIQNVGKEFYQRGEDARSLAPIGDEGFVDPESGKFLNSPVGDEKRALALTLAALSSQDKLAKVGADQEIAAATLANNEWYRRNQLALEKMGVDIRDLNARMTIMKNMSDPNFRFYLQSNGVDPSGIVSPMSGGQMSAPPQGQPTVQPPMPQQPVPQQQMPQGGAPAPQNALPMATGAAQPQAPAGGIVPIPGRNSVTFLPGAEVYGTDPQTGTKVFQKDGMFFAFDPNTGAYSQIQPPGFKNNAEIKAQADAANAQRGVNDANAWTERNAKDPNTPYVSYEDYMKNGGNQRERADKHMDERRQSLESMRDIKLKLQEFQRLNELDQTGGPIDRLMPESNMAQAFSPNSQKMQAISADIKANSVPKGQGAVSDAERKLFGAAVPGIQYDRDVNNAIIGMYDLRMRFREDAAALEREYYQKFGHINGMDQYVADQLTAKYSNDPEYQRLSTLIPGSASNVGKPPASENKPRFTVIAD